jgi:hypothetical protein
MAKRLKFPKSLNESVHKKDFLAFHKKNPIVYTTLRKLALELVKRGYDKIGVGLLWERMRWELMLIPTQEDFKLNNDYRACYARLLMENEKKLSGAFDTRTKERC